MVSRPPSRRKPRKTHPIPHASARWRLALQHHKAKKRSGEHWDVRLVDPKTGFGHSWAVPKKMWPSAERKKVLAVQTPTHGADYATLFSGPQPDKTHAVSVDASPHRISFTVPNVGPIVLRRTRGDKWHMSPGKVKQASHARKLRLVKSMMAGKASPGLRKLGTQRKAAILALATTSVVKQASVAAALAPAARLAAEAAKTTKTRAVRIARKVLLPETPAEVALWWGTRALVPAVGSSSAALAGMKAAKFLQKGRKVDFPFKGIQKGTGKGTLSRVKLTQSDIETDLRAAVKKLRKQKIEAQSKRQAIQMQEEHRLTQRNRQRRPRLPQH